MNKLLATFCTGLCGLGLLILVCCFRQAAKDDWAPEIEGTEEPLRVPLEWAAFGGLCCVLVGPLLYFAGRSSRPDNVR